MKLPSLQRIALFIMFDEMERDLVNIALAASQEDKNNVLTVDEKKKAHGRAKNLNYEDETLPVDSLIHYLDLGDKINIAMRLKKAMPDAHSKYLNGKVRALEAAIPIRNSVMHGRPLTVAEYSQGFALASDLARSPHYWPSLSRSLRQYNANPESIRTRSIEILETSELGETLNNLPIPDYDDTGFLPRQKLEAELRKKILSRHPVVTVLGDGGNGKTALTLQTLYGLIYDPGHDFDAIIWVSAKSSTLTPNEIKRIEGAITTSSGIFSKAAETFDNNVVNPLESVRNLLEKNKILLVIDNLETVLDQSIRDFVSDVPGESKILFTSRIPIGSDTTISVEGFSDKDAVTYLRRVIEAYAVESLRKFGDEKLQYFARRLGGKPLLLKWLALSVRAGADPNAIVSHPKDALKFCLENVFDSLDRTTADVLSVIAQLPRAVSLEVLRYVSNIDILVLERSISILLQYTIVQTRDSSSETVYELKPFARAYVSKIMNLKPDDVQGVLSRYRSLEGVVQDETGAANQNKYDMKVYTVRNTSEALCVRSLRMAIAHALNGRYENALGIIENAKIANPGYFELYRVEAFIQFTSGDHISANDSYGRAIDLAPDVPQLRLFYAGFLTRAYQEYEKAIAEIEEALKIDTQSPDLKIEMSRLKMFKLDFSGALDTIRSIVLPDGQLRKRDVKIVDIQFNIHKRHVEFLLSRGGIDSQIESAIQDWSEFHETVDPRLIDTKYVDKMKIFLSRINPPTGRYAEYDWTRLKAALEENISVLNLNQTSSLAFRDGEVGIKGKIKPQGLRTDFGFLVTRDGSEIFIHQSSCAPSCWEGIREGRECYFTTTMDESGRLKVANARLT